MFYQDVLKKIITFFAIFSVSVSCIAFDVSLPENKRWIIIEGRGSSTEAQAVAELYRQYFQYLGVFSQVNKYGKTIYSVTIGQIDYPNNKNYYDNLKLEGKIPHDSFLTRGTTYSFYSTLQTSIPKPQSRQETNSQAQQDDESTRRTTAIIQILFAFGFEVDRRGSIENDDIIAQGLNTFFRNAFITAALRSLYPQDSDNLINQKALYVKLIMEGSFSLKGVVESNIHDAFIEKLKRENPSDALTISFTNFLYELYSQRQHYNSKN